MLLQIRSQRKVRAHEDHLWDGIAALAGYLFMQRLGAKDSGIMWTVILDGGIYAISIIYPRHRERCDRNFGELLPDSLGWIVRGGIRDPVRYCQLLTLTGVALKPVSAPFPSWPS